MYFFRAALLLPALLWLAERVGGWGRVYVVEALCRRAGAEVRSWLLRRACDGDFLNGYFAGRVATAAHLHEAITGAGIPVQVPRAGTLVGLHFSATPVHDYDEAEVGADTGRYAAFFHAMLDQGIALAPGAYEALFPSLAHTQVDIERTVDAAARAAGQLVEGAG